MKKVTSKLIKSSFHFSNMEPKVLARTAAKTSAKNVSKVKSTSKVLIPNQSQMSIYTVHQKYYRAITDPTIINNYSTPINICSNIYNGLNIKAGNQTEHNSIEILSKALVQAINDMNKSLKEGSIKFIFSETKIDDYITGTPEYINAYNLSKQLNGFIKKHKDSFIDEKAYQYFNIAQLICTSMVMIKYRISKKLNKGCY